MKAHHSEGASYILDNKKETFGEKHAQHFLWASGYVRE
jgi:hypothetical protein